MEHTSNSNSGYESNYDYWEHIARTKLVLTSEEKKVIYSCGGLSYLNTYLRECKDKKLALYRSVSEKNYLFCVKNCICGRNYNLDEDNQDDKFENGHDSHDSHDTKPFEWWEQRARDPRILSGEEATIINNCGGLSYIRHILDTRGIFECQMRTVSNKYYAECGSDCVCKK